MTILLESLYKLSQRDQQVSWLDPVTFRDTNAFAAAQNVRILNTVPADRLMILHNLCATISIAGAETVTGITVDMVPQLSAATLNVTAYRPPAAGSASAALNWSGEMIVPPQWTLRVTYEKSAAVAVATVLLGLSGLLVPIGNVQRI